MPSSPLQRPATDGARRTFMSLRQRNFRIFWMGQTISVIGTWMQTVGQAWLVLELTHSALQLGVVGALQAVPILLFSLIGGVVADRWPKRLVLIGTQSCAMIQALLLWALVATGSVQLWHVYVLAALLGLTNCLDLPVRQAFLVELVGRDSLTNAAALSSSVFNIARILGPSLGGVVIATRGVGTLFLLNALSFVVMLAALGLIRGDDLHGRREWATTGAPQSAWQSLREGLSLVMRTPAMVWLISIVGLVLLFGSNFNVVLPLFATDVLHLGATGFGFLSAASGCGSIVAALWLAWSNLRPTIGRVLVGIVVFGVAEVGFALSQFPVLSLTLIVGVGAAEELFGTLAVIMLQTIAPHRLRGRVTGVYIFFFNGSVPLGYLMTGWLSTQYGPSTGLLLLALASIAVAGAGEIWRIAAGSTLTTTVPEADPSE